MANKAQVVLEGAETLHAVLNELPKAVRGEVLAEALKKAVVPIRRHTIAKAPKDTGALKKSITAKVIAYPKDGRAVALIGPDRNYYMGNKRVRKGGDRRGANKPSKYAHLVEFGHYSGVSSLGFGGFAKGTTLRKKTAQARSFILPRPFLRPGLMAGASAANTILSAEIENAMAKVRARMIKSGTRAA